MRHLAAGANHVIVVATNGQAYGWGDNEFGQLGIGKLVNSSFDSYVKTPSLLFDFANKKIIMAACGSRHSLFLTGLGKVYSAGFNEQGQLGVQSTPLDEK